MAQEYDKIIKENLKPIVLSLLHKTLGIEIQRHELLYPELTYTHEREADFILLIYTKQGEKIVYHLEFQTDNDAEMLERMYIYAAFLYKIHKTTLKQFVFYIGDKKSNMKTHLRAGDSTHSYTIISMKDIAANVFLASDIPEEVLLAILCDFGTEAPDAVIEGIFNKICAISESQIKTLRHLRQLQVLAKLRQKEDVIKELIQKNNIYMLDFEQLVTTDEFFIKGELKGKAEGKAEEKETMVYAMLKRGLDLSLIADISELPLKVIKAMQKEQKSL